MHNPSQAKRKPTRLTAALLLMLSALLLQTSNLYSQTGDTDPQEIREAYLQDLLELISPHPNPDHRPRNVVSSFERLSHQDHTWYDWLERTGELPPNFDEMPSIPLLPNPLILDEGGENIPVQTMTQWEEQRDRINEHVKHLLSGTFPSPPGNLQAEVLESHIENGVTVEQVRLRFGPGHRATLHLEVLTPPGEGRFPVFLTQLTHAGWSNQRGWAQIALQRGYIAVLYTGSDDRDDTWEYQEIYPGYDWTALMTRAWGAHRAVDYIYTLDSADHSKIALTGHSRYTKTSLLAAAFDDRITAVISSSGGTGGEFPYRYTDDRHSNESIDLLTSIRPQWLHPRLRFYTGREHKLPIDQNSLIALIAPNSLLLSTSIREGGGGDAWAVEQMYHSLRDVYEFLEVPEKLGIRMRDGDHDIESRDMEAYIDWLDLQFGRSSIPQENKIYYDYSFEKWKDLSGEVIDPHDFPEIPAGQTLLSDEQGNAISTSGEWLQNREVIQSQINWLLGEAPPRISAKPVGSLHNGADYVNSFLNRPRVSNGRMQYIAPYNAVGEYLNGALYYPSDENGEMKTRENGKLPVVIFLHKYSNTGYDGQLSSLFDNFLSKGIAVFAMDLIGFGTRIEEGTYFYDRYPHWSKLGKMVTDTRAAVDALESLEFIDNEQIFLSGFALGGTVSLFTSALDERIAATAVSGAFTPLRNATGDVEGIKAYSHLHGLLPRLGFFLDEPGRISVDFPEILSAIAPRPLMVIAPELDRHADFENVRKSMEQISTVFDLLNVSENLQFSAPFDFTRFTSTQQDEVVNWLNEISAD
ncbi:MAG: acetylxylan esterase [Balneolaceae bacterium]|nr:acetylxylan esterase [Balneolaceae bacterium]